MTLRTKLSAAVVLTVFGFQSSAQQPITVSPEKTLTGDGQSGVLIQDWANGDFSIPRLKTDGVKESLDCSNPAYAASQQCAKLVVPKIDGITGKILK